MTVQAALIAGLFTASGVGLQTYGTHVSTQKDLRTSCVKRLDEREQNLRTKAEFMLVSISKTLSYPYHPNPSHEELALRYETAVASAEALIANSPPKLATKTMNLLGKFMTASQQTDDEKVRVAQAADFAGEVNPWHAIYFEQLMAFDVERKGC
ncbi:hypothetical protein [Pseudomonas sp. TNT2022 ID642]|uniref:hypothetical protein n=1 Tax=Pseudomonas sp. TNT2022 ID642 TaxID=2942632 RepID=UPI00235F6880|nr:hypothetical protein [Pseudomonas sp. TNT2022 ID642]MDD1002382.1 hypothetical protein [Pseudomonas sp. TNT2022 ID642]